METKYRKRDMTIPAIIITITLILMFAGLAIYNVYITGRDDSTEREYDNIRSIVYVEGTNCTASEESATDEEQPDAYEEFLNSCNNRELYEEYLLHKSPNFDILKINNDDTIAYIEIPDTPVSYPVVQNADNSFYLRHSITKKDNLNGAIYIENYNKPDFSDPVTVVYGHHLVNKSMFGSLTDYMDDEYWNNHKYFFIYTPGHTYVYEVVLASKYSAQHLLEDAFVKSPSGEYKFKGLNDDMTLKIFNRIKNYVSISESQVSNSVNYGDRLVVLSTCCDNSMRRYLVVGKRIL